MAEDTSNKPHPATPKKRDEFRDQGKFPKARDTTAIATMLAVLLVITFGHESVVALLDTAFHRCHGDLSAITRGDGALIAGAAPKALLYIAAPPAIAAAIAGAAAGAWQSGLRFYPEMLKPRFDKLNPIPQLLNLINPKTAAFELTLAILRVGVVGYVCYLELINDIPTLLGLTGAPIAHSLTVTAVMLLRMTLKALVVLVIMAILDYIYNRQKLEKEMRMSDQDIKEEMRQFDQDPHIKAKLKEKQRLASQKRVLAAMADADAVVTNPTHIAVAIRYAATDLAPIVVAKGHDHLALRIRKEARKRGIVIIENRPLARALDAEVEMGQAVPGQHFVAVAKVLAFVYSIKGRSRDRQRTPATAS
jgi:flagellar biosynthetic protein FlhB